MDLSIAARPWTECGLCPGGVHTVDDAGTRLADAGSADSSIALYVWYEGGNENGEVVVTA